MHRDEQDIDDGPDAQASEAEQLANPLLPVAQVESIGAKAAQSEADQQGGAPAIALRPVAAQVAGEGTIAQTEHVLVHGAVGAEGFVRRRVAAGALAAALLPQLRLVAVAAVHLPLEAPLALALDIVDHLASDVQVPAVEAAVIVVAPDAGKLQAIAGRVLVVRAEHVVVAVPIANGAAAVSGDVVQESACCSSSAAAASTSSVFGSRAGHYWWHIHLVLICISVAIAIARVAVVLVIAFCVRQVHLVAPAGRLAVPDPRQHEDHDQDNGRSPVDHNALALEPHFGQIKRIASRKCYCFFSTGVGVLVAL